MVRWGRPGAYRVGSNGNTTGRFSEEQNVNEYRPMFLQHPLNTRKCTDDVSNRIHKADRKHQHNNEFA